MHIINNCIKKYSILIIYITTPKFMNLFNRTLFGITKDYTYIIC